MYLRQRRITKQIISIVRHPMKGTVKVNYHCTLLHAPQVCLSTLLSDIIVMGSSLGFLAGTGKPKTRILLVAPCKE